MRGKQEYSSRTLGATWGIISAIMIPIVIVLICIGWRLLLRKKAEEKEDREFMNIKPLDPEESLRINSDDESIPYKKDTSDDTPEPTEPVKVVDNQEPSPEPIPPAPMPAPLPVVGIPYPAYGMPYDQSRQARPYGGETEIN
uniref:SFRICE_010217 n=1 Tax=Spodoptera frugiperda TaxID=7108 RepID=A0A2H1V8T1_SPOFR